MIKDETEPAEAKNLMQANAKFCEVFTLKISFFSLSTKSFREIGKVKIVNIMQHTPSTLS